MEDDEQLLYAWREGDKRAGEQLFKRHYDPVSRFFANKIRERPDDFVQDTFMACVQGRDRIRNGHSFRSYLFGIAYNLLKNHFGRRRQLPEDFGTHRSIHDLSPGPSTMMHKSEEERLLLEALRRIPMMLQTALELRYWEELNSSEIAQVLGIPATTIRSRLKRARELLEQALRDDSSQDELVESTIRNLDAWADAV